MKKLLIPVLLVALLGCAEQDKKAIEWNNKGDSLADLSRHEESLKSYDKAIELNPDYADAWYNKGNALTKLGRTEEAMKAFVKARELGSQR